MTWKSFKLTELGFVGRGRSKHRPRNAPILYEGKYPFFQTADIKDATLYLRNYSQTYNEVGLAQSKLWNPGTLCITIAANIAETAILAIPGCFPDSIIGFIPDQDKADVRFVKYYVDTIKLQMQSISRGTTQDNLSLEKLASFDFLIPSLTTQKKIADILSSYDDLIENNTKRIKILEEMAQLLYREWFVHFRFPGHENVKMVESELGMIPDGWELLNVKNIVKRHPPGKLYEKKTVSAEGTVPVLDQGQSGIIGYHNDAPGVEASEETPVIVFANHTCYQRLIHFPFSAIQNVLPFYPNLGHFRNIYWLHYATKDLISFNDYKGHWPEYMEKKVVVPPSKLAEDFGSLVKPNILLSFNLQKICRNLSQTRDLLLPKLISGKIDV